MDTLRELMSLGRENWHLLKDVLSMIGGAATVLGLLATLSGFKRRRAEKAELRKQGRDAMGKIKQREDRDRSEWFAYLFRHKQAVWDAEHVDKMTVQQACGYLGDDLPEWARDGWERVLVGDLNKPIRKV